MEYSTLTVDKAFKNKAEYLDRHIYILGQFIFGGTCFNTGDIVHWLYSWRYYRLSKKNRTCLIADPTFSGEQRSISIRTPQSNLAVESNKLSKDSLNPRHEFNNQVLEKWHTQKVIVGGLLYDPHDRRETYYGSDIIGTLEIESERIELFKNWRNNHP